MDSYRQTASAEDMVDAKVDIARLQTEMAALKTQLSTIEGKLDGLVTLASEGKGGIRALWFAGSVVAGVLGWIGADRLLK